MARHVENRTNEDAVELLKENGYSGLPKVVTVLKNNINGSARFEYLKEALFERSVERLGWPARDGEDNDQRGRYRQRRRETVCALG